MTSTWKWALSLCISVTFSAAAEAAKSVDEVRDLISKDSKKVSTSSRDPSELLNKYYEKTTGELIATENIVKYKTTHITFFKAGKKEGFDSEWYLSGKMKSEIPFKNGVIDGVCRHWDEAGSLIGCYKIENGTGVRKVYFSNGRLHEETHMENGALEGLDLVLYDNGQVRVINHRSKDRFVGTSPSFHSNGRLRFVATCDSAERPVGPAIDFNEDEEPVGKTKFFIDGNEVSETEYRTARTNAQSLPDWTTADECKKWVHDKFDALIAQYKALPLVKIPLDDLKN